MIQRKETLNKQLLWAQISTYGQFKPITVSSWGMLVSNILPVERWNLTEVKSFSYRSQEWNWYPDTGLSL